MTHLLTRNQAVKWAATAEYLKKAQPHKKFTKKPKNTPEHKKTHKKTPIKLILTPVVSLAASSLALYPALSMINEFSHVYSSGNGTNEADSRQEEEKEQDQRYAIRGIQSSTNAAYTGVVFTSAALALASGILLRAFTAS